MEEYSMLLEHALLASGDIAESGAIYAGWPARQFEQRRDSEVTLVPMLEIEKKNSKFSV
jgi:hypothetical protein